MHKNQWYRETEQVIKQYFIVKDRVDRLQKKESAVRRSIEIIEGEIQELKRIPRLTAKYGVHPGGTRCDEDYSQLMVEYDEQLLRLQQKLFRKRRQLIKLRVRIMEIEEWLAPIEGVIGRLSDDELALLEQRYIYRRSNNIIALTIHCDEGTVRYRIRQAIIRVAELLGKTGNQVLLGQEA